MSQIVCCDHLTKHYGQIKALDNISLTLESGKIIGLLGPNGSGKTSTKVSCCDNCIVTY